MKPLFFSLKCGLALLLVPGSAAHEIQDNRATIVLRDKTHVSLLLYIAYGDALHLALAPRRPVQEFLVAYSAMNPETLQKELSRAQARFQSDIRLYLADGRPIPLTNWVWPEAKRVQAMFQQRVMQTMVDPAAHVHEEPLEIRADANTREEVTAVRVQFPEEFQKVLVVWYRASQAWVESKSWSPALKFP
jgi:hypothetical protein